jgi:hypothetical protein
MVDGHEQAIPRLDFNWQQVSDAKCVDWTEKQVAGAFTYPGQVEFTRELIHPCPGVWEVVDKFTGHENHKLDQWGI